MSWRSERYCTTRPMAVRNLDTFLSTKSVRLPSPSQIWETSPIDGQKEAGATPGDQATLSTRPWRKRRSDTPASRTCTTHTDRHTNAATQRFLSRVNAAILCHTAPPRPHFIRCPHDFWTYILQSQYPSATFLYLPYVYCFITVTWSNPLLSLLYDLIKSLFIPCY